MKINAVDVRGVSLFPSNSRFPLDAPKISERTAIYSYAPVSFATRKSSENVGSIGGAGSTDHALSVGAIHRETIGQSGGKNALYQSDRETNGCTLK